VPNERYADRYAFTEALLPIVRNELMELVRAGCQEICVDEPSMSCYAQREDPNRAGKIAQMQIAEIDGAEPEPAANLFGDGSGDHDAARFRIGLKTRGDVHAITVDVVLFDDRVSDVDRHAKGDPLFGGLLSGPRGHGPLHRQRTLRGVMRAVEHRQEAIAGILDQTSAIGPDAGIKHLRTQAHQPGVSRFLVQFGQPRVADDVGGKNGNKATLRR